MKNRKNLKRFLALALSAALSFTNVISSMADIKNGDTDSYIAGTDMTKEQLKEALSQDKELYPEGRFEFFISQVNAKEGEERQELIIVRRGGTESEATVDFKSVDVSAAYGDDYLLTVEESDKVSKTLDGIGKPLSDFNSPDMGVPDAEQTTAEDKTADGEESEKAADGTKVSNGTALQNAKDTFLKTDSSNLDWQQLDEAQKAEEEAENKEYNEAYNEFAGDIEGIDYTFTFKKGECIKSVYIDVIDDEKAESDEQVMFLLSNASSGEVAGTTTAYLNIKDNEESEKAIFAMDAKEMTVDRSEGKAVITINRVSGNNTIASVIVGTGGMDAKAGSDYEAVQKEIIFPQGVTQQTVEIELMDYPGAPSKAKFQVALDANESYVQEDCAITTVNLTNHKADTYSGTTADAEDMSADAAWEWNDTRDVSGYANVSWRSNSWSGRKTFLTGIDLSTASSIEITWRSDEGSTSYERTSGSGCNKKSWTETVRGRNSYIYINGNQSCTRYREFGTVTDHYILKDRDKVTNSTFQVEVLTTGANKNATVRVSKVVIHYPGYQYTVTNTAYTDGTCSNQYTEKIYTDDEGATLTDAYGHKYKKGNTILLGTLQISRNGENNFGDSVVLHRSQDTIQFHTTYSNNRTSNGVQVKEGTSGNVYLAGYQLMLPNSKSWSEMIPPQDIKLSKEFITKYKSYIFNGNEFRIRPVYRPYDVRVMFQNGNTGKGSYANGFKTNEVLRCTSLDTIKVTGIAKEGYSVAGFNIGCYKDNEVHQTGINENTLAARANNYYKKSDKTAVEEAKKISAPGYTKSAVTTAKASAAISNVVTFTPTAEFTYISPVYSVPKITAKIDPRNNDKDKGAVVYSKDDNVQQGDYRNPLVISGVTLNREYTLNAVTEDGFKAYFKNFTGDVDGNGVISTQEEAVVSRYNFLRTASNGNAYTFRPVIDNTLIYYGFVPKVENRYSGCIDGVVAIQDKPIFGNKVTQKPVNGAQISVAGMNTTSKKDDKFGGLKGTGGDGYFSLSSREFVAGENQTLNISYNNVYLTATQPANAAGFYVLDSYDTIGVNAANVFSVNGSNIKRIRVSDVSNGDTTYRFTIQTYSKNDSIRATKALYKFYRKDGTAIDKAEQTVESTNGTFTLDFNPKTLGVTPGSTMTVQFFDQNGVGYYEHDMGFSFAESVGVISFLSSFNFGGAEKTLELIGTIDSVFNFGWDGDLDNISDAVSNSEDGTVKTIQFGYSFEKDKDFSVKEKKKDAVKDAAKNSGTTKEQKKKQNEAAANAVDKNKKSNKSKTKIGGSAEIGMSFALEINLVKSDDDEHKGQWYFRDMMLCATVDGGVEVTVSYVTPVGIPVRARLRTGASGSATFIIDQNYDKDEYYISQVMDKTAGKVDLFNFNMKNADRAFDSYGIFNISPYIDLSAGAGFDFLNLMIGGKAAFDMNFYTRSDQKNTGDVTFSAYIEMKILFFKKKWDIASKKINMFGDSSSIEQLSGNADYTYESLSGMEADTRAYLKNRTEWMGESDMKAQSVAGTSGVEEFVLENGVNPNPDIKVQALSNGRYLAVFLDDNKEEDTYNCTHVYYTIGDGETWSKPALIENDGTTDDAPSIFDLGEKGIYVAWSSADRKLNADDTVIATLNSMNIHGAFFDTEKMVFGDIQQITFTSPYSYKDEEGYDVADNVADVEPHVSYDAETNRMLMYYTKIEYTSTAQDDKGLVGDVAKPYSLIAYRVYDFTTGRWEDTYTQEEAMDENYTKAWYGQRFLDLAPLAVVNEKMDESGYWTEAPEIKEYTKATYTGADGNTYEQDPIVIESASTTYNGLGLFAYVLDYDGNKETESDRDIFLQIYNYSENKFSHPIMITTSSDVAESKIGFGRCGSTTLLTYLSDNTLYALNISYIVKFRLLETTVAGQNIYYVDKTAPTGQEKEGDHVYMPPVIVAGAAVDGVNENDTEDDNAIIDYKVASTDNFVYVFWTQRSTKVKEGIDENSEEALDTANRVAESQIYAARYDTHAEIITSPVKVTDEEGANYGSLGFAVSEGEVGNVKMLATKSKSVVETMERTGESGEAIKTDILTEDTENKELVALDFTPVSTLVVQDAAIAELMAGTDTGVSMNLYNDGLQTLTDLTLSVKDVQDKEIYTKTIKADEDDTTEDCIYGGRLYPVNFPITVGEDAVDYKFSYTVTDNAGKILAKGSYSEDIPLQVDVTEFEAATDERGNIKFTAMVENNSKRKSGVQKVSILRKINEVEKDYKEITSFNTEDLLPGQSGYYELTYDYGKYEDMFSTFISEGSESLEAITYFKAVCGENGESAEDKITMEASKEQRLRMSAIQKVTLVDGNNKVIESSYTLNDGDIAQINTAVESLSYSGSRYEGNDDAENYDKSNAAGLKVMYKSDNEDVLTVYDNGYVEAVGEGTANITAYVMPSNSKQFYSEETGTLVEDNFATLPQEAMIVKNVKVTVGNPVPEKTAISEGTVKLSGKSYNWTGKTITPKVTVKNKSGKTLKAGTDYTVKYSTGRKNVGTYKVTIKGKGNYKGTVTKSFKITVSKNKTYSVGGYRFKITKNYSGSKPGSVTITKAANKKMTAIKIADSVKIGGRKFNVTAIGNNAFSGFTKVKNVTIGKNVTSIGSKAFYNCKNLSRITIHSTKLSSVGSKAIYKIAAKAIIKVPSSKVSAYRKKFTRKTGFTNKMSIKKK